QEDIATRIRAIFAEDEVARICDVLEAGDNSEALRLVGGTLRDILLGARLGTDRDFATPLLPDEVESRLSRAGVQTLAIGKSHGTVIAVLPTDDLPTAGHRHLEITTLRRDIETDGRHAKVTFTTDWYEDSCRRDFTINALYADKDGKIYDFHEGLQDLEQRRVRFVGDAAARIREDYLRVLRFYRFTALLGDYGGDFGSGASASCAECAAAVGALSQLSGERVWSELKKLLSVERGWVSVLGAMEGDGVLAALLPFDLLISDCAAVARALYELETQLALTFTDAELPLFRFASLFALSDSVEATGVAVKQLADRLHLSRHEQDYLRFVMNPPSEEELSLDSDIAWRKPAHRLGKEKTSHRLSLLRVRGALPNNALFADRMDLLHRWNSATLPVNGKDLVTAFNLKEGPELGRILQTLEDWWLAQDCKPDKMRCLEYTRTLLQE
ncbi:MAG: CCA tRNA nucleotidyltransferase, partial [Alphaproteobacteria bacterium]